MPAPVADHLPSFDAVVVLGVNQTRAACYTLDARLARVYAIEPTAPYPSASRWPARDVEGRHASPQGWKSETSRMGMNVGSGTGIREALVSSACASEWSRSSLVAGHLPERHVYKRVWSRSDISRNPVIIIINLIL